MPDLPNHLHTPEVVAGVLGCSAWWVKEQCRKGRIPFTKLGGAYRFTSDHVAEIIEIFEERPTGAHLQQDRGSTVRRLAQVQTTASTSKLRARPPRRTQKNGSDP